MITTTNDRGRAAPGRGGRGGRGGFTLAEVMVAMVIISVAMVALLVTHAASTRSYAAAKATTVSALLARQKVAEILTGEFPEPGEEEGTFPENERYGYLVSIRETPIEELREVTVQVALIPPGWGGEAPAIGAVAVTTSVADPGREEEEEGEAEAE